MPVTKAEWITEEASQLGDCDDSDREPLPRPRKRLKSSATKTKTRERTQPSHRLFPRLPHDIGGLLLQRDYCSALTPGLPLGNRHDLTRKMIVSLSCSYAVTNMQNQSEHSEVFGKDYPLEYSPDGRFLLGLNFPLRSHHADLLLMDTNARTIHHATSPNGHRNYMFTWTSSQSFVTGSLSPHNDEALCLWDVRNLATPVFSQPTDSSLGFELMDDKWLIGVHTEKMFGRSPKSPFCQWCNVRIKQANIDGFKEGHLDIQSHSFDVFRVHHDIRDTIQKYGPPYTDGGLVRYQDERVVILAESFSLPPNERSSQWPRIQAVLSQSDHQSEDETNLPFRSDTSQPIHLSIPEPSLCWMEGLHPDPRNDGFIVMTKHVTRSNKSPRLTKVPRTTVTKNFVSYYKVRKAKDGKLELHKTATMGVAEGELSPHPEWKKPSYFKFAPNGLFVGQLVNDKLRIVTNGSFMRSFTEENKGAVADLVISNEVSFSGNTMRNFAVSPLDNLTCAVSAKNGRIFVVHPVW